MTPDGGSPRDIVELLDQLQAMGRTGLAYATNPYSIEDYRKLVELSSEFYGAYLGVAPEEIRERWLRETGQITPKVGAEAAIFDERGRILVLRRVDDGTWGLPAGWLEPNESPAEAAVRETLEETGMEVEIVRMVDVFTRRAGQGASPHAAVAVVYLCRPLRGEPRVTHESTEVGFRHLEEVPEWHGWHREHAEAAYRLWTLTRASSLRSSAPPLPHER